MFTIGNQLDEGDSAPCGRRNARDCAEEEPEMPLVGIAMPDHVYASLPAPALPGGMRQRVMIAMALCCNPKLMIADEPTTALDVTIQAQILDLLRDVKNKISGSIMLITHDLGVIAEMVDYVVVMYALPRGRREPCRRFSRIPATPYTIGLRRASPSWGGSGQAVQHPRKRPQPHQYAAALLLPRPLLHAVRRLPR